MSKQGCNIFFLKDYLREKKVKIMLMLFQRQISRNNISVLCQHTVLWFFHWRKYIQGNLWCMKIQFLNKLKIEASSKIILNC